MMQNMPIVIPKRERKVRSLLTVTDLTADKKLSLKSLNLVLTDFSVMSVSKIINYLDYKESPYGCKIYNYFIWSVMKILSILSA